MAKKIGKKGALLPGGRSIVASSRARKRTLTVGKYIGKTLGWVKKHDGDYFKEIKSTIYKELDPVTQRSYDNLLKDYIRKDVANYEEKFDELVDFIYKERIVDKTPFDALQARIMRVFPGISHELCQKAKLNVEERVRKEVSSNREFLIDIHTLRYEELYAQCIDPDLTNVPLDQKKYVLAESYLSAIDTLVQKEKMLGMYSPTFKVQIVTASKRKKVVAGGLSFDGLTSSEKIELLRLIEKSQPKEEIIAVTGDSDSEETEGEIITPQLLIENPVSEVKEEDKTAVMQSQQIPTVTLMDIQSQIKSKVQEQLKKAMEKKLENKK